MGARGSLARLGALVLTASAMLGGAACSLVAGLDKLTFTDAGVCGQACDDADPCTKDDCLIDGVCHGAPVPDGPVLTDPIGDCQITSCAVGAVQVTGDDTDVPADDGSSCTDERCTDGKPSHPSRPDGDACTSPGGLVGSCDAGACAVTARAYASSAPGRRAPPTRSASAMCALSPLACASERARRTPAVVRAKACFAKS